jgi:hypothetical protein
MKPECYDLKDLINQLRSSPVPMFSATRTEARSIARELDGVTSKSGLCWHAFRVFAEALHSAQSGVASDGTDRLIILKIVA